MGLDVSKIEEMVLSEYSEIIRLDTIFNKLKAYDLPFDIVLDKLDEALTDLRGKDYFVKFILFDKGTEPYKLLGRKYFDIVKRIESSYSLRTFKLFFDDYSLEDIFYRYYKPKPPFIFRFNYLRVARKLIKDHNIFLLKTDVLALLDNFSIAEDDIFLIKNFEDLGCNHYKDWKSEQDYNEFSESKVCDLAFELWLDDKQGSIDKLRNLSLANQQITNLQTQIAELTAENERLRSNQAEPLPPSEHIDYDGDIPPRTNEEKLACFIRLLIDHNPQINLHSDERSYTGRQVKTQLESLVTTAYTRKYGGLPSHNTIAKYLNE